MSEQDDALARIAAIVEAEEAIDSPPLAPATEAAAETGTEGGESPPEGPRALGYSLEAMNRRYALVLLGAKAVIYEQNPTAPLEEQQRFLTIDAFNAWFANRFTEVRDKEGKVKAMPWSKAWLSSRERRSYKGVEFHPDPKDAPGTADYLNLWSGFAVKPRPKANGYSVFRDHLVTNVCGGSEEYFRWVFAFFADIVQNPREKKGVSLVLRGRMGSGKTKVGEVFGSLFPRHYFLVDDPRYVTGQFNAHMASCLLLQADEAVWAGDKAAEGRLKGLVTAPIQQIENKGVDPIRLKNHVRLVMTSNEDWVVPAGKDERRFCVLDVDPRCAQQSDYFREMDEQLANGGLEALLADLLAFDLSTVNLRAIPKTAALLEQKVRSLDSVERWLYDLLMRGTTSRLGDEWLREVPFVTLFDDYQEAADRIGIKRRAEETLFATKVRKIIPGITKRRGMGTMKDQVARRVWLWQMPALHECREAFAAAMHQEVIWDAAPDDAPEAAWPAEPEDDPYA